MRIIKLSPNDPDFRTRTDVDTFFLRTLPDREPSGQFLLTERGIGSDGISEGEKLLFTYKGECVYQARASSRRMKYDGPESATYPFYFCVDVPSIEVVQGTLREI